MSTWCLNADQNWPYESIQCDIQMQLEHFSNAILVPLNETFSIVPRVRDILRYPKSLFPHNKRIFGVNFSLLFSIQHHTTMTKGNGISSTWKPHQRQYHQRNRRLTHRWWRSACIVYQLWMLKQFYSEISCSTIIWFRFHCSVYYMLFAFVWAHLGALLKFLFFKSSMNRCHFSGVIVILGDEISSARTECHQLDYFDGGSSDICGTCAK